MGEGFADVWALMRCWQLAAGLPSAVAFGYRAVQSLATAYEAIVAPIVARTVTDPGERARLGRALKANSLKAGAAILSYARLTGAEQRQDIAAIAGTITRLYDDLTEASPDMSAARALATLFYAVPGTAKSGPELLLAELASEIRQRLHPLPRTVSSAFSALHDYQCSSREQREDAVPLPVVDKICRGKGAMGHLTLCSLVKPEMGTGEAELVMALGEALQSLDDYADVEEDTRDGIVTLAALGATTLADIGADMRALRRRLLAHYGRAASRRYCGILFYLMAQTVTGRRLPIVGRIASRLAARSATLAFLTRGPNAVPTALPLREDA
jgi:hypothetical protein